MTYDEPHTRVRIVPVAYDFAPGPTDHRSVAMAIEEPLPIALRRITGSQLERAISGFTDPDADFDTVVHSARKSMKRVRGLLRLVRDEIGYHHYRNENVVLRDTARPFGPVRDAVVMIETLDRVIEHVGKQIRPDTFGQTRSWLVDRHLDLRSAVMADRDLMTGTVFTLKAARARFAGTTVMTKADGSPYIRDSLAAIAPGIRRVYRRGRRGYRRALEEQRTETLHEWRKRVKYLRYQMEMLELLGPELFGAMAGLLDDLGELLGNGHDLAHLSDLIETHPGVCVDPHERSLLLLVIDDIRRDTTHRALGIGSFLYDEPPDAFVERIGWHWSAVRGDDSA